MKDVIFTPEEIDKLEAELLTAPSLYENSSAADLIATVRALREELAELGTELRKSREDHLCVLDDRDRLRAMIDQMRDLGD